MMIAYLGLKTAVAKTKSRDQTHKYKIRFLAKVHNTERVLPFSISPGRRHDITKPSMIMASDEIESAFSDTVSKRYAYDYFL